MKTICIDFGHCKTAAAWPHKDGGQYKFDKLQLDSQGSIVIASQIALNINQIMELNGKLRPSFEDIKELGEIVIGDEIQLSDKELEIFSYFKMQPLEEWGNNGFDSTARSVNGTDITYGQLIACFFHALLDNIFRFNNIHGTFQADKLDIFVGCPAGSAWMSDDAMREYENLLKNALNAKSIKIIPESRAAVFSSIASQNNKNKIKRYSAEDGVAVCDFGSLTADFTYMLLGRRKIEFSWNLGAGLIERSMTKIAENSINKNLQDYSTKTSFEKVRNIFRKAKENFYSGKIDPDNAAQNFTFIDNKDNKHKGSIEIDEQLMQQAVRGQKHEIKVIDNIKTKTGSWEQLLVSFFEEAKAKINGLPLSTIVLSGGASKMGFIKEICSDIFNNNKIEIFVDENPSLTIANGLAVTAIVDNVMDDYTKQVYEQIKQDESCSIKKLKATLEQEIFEKIKALFSNCIDIWSENERALSLEDLRQEMQSEIDHNDMQRELKNILNTEISKYIAKLLDKIYAAVIDKAQKKLYSGGKADSYLFNSQNISEKLSLSEFKLGEFAISQTTQVDYSFLKGFAFVAVTIAGGVAGGLGGAALGEGAAMTVGTLGGGPVGTVVGEIVGTLAAPVTGTIGYMVGAMVGAVAASFMSSDDDLSKPMKKSVREKSAAKYKKYLDKNRSSLLAGFRQSFSKFELSYDEWLFNIILNIFKIITLRKFDLDLGLDFDFDKDQDLDQDLDLETGAV